MSALMDTTYMENEFKKRADSGDGLFAIAYALMIISRTTDCMSDGLELISREICAVATSIDTMS